MYITEKPGRVDVISNPWAPWLGIPLIAFWGMCLFVTIIGPLLALAGIAIIAWNTRCRRWRFDSTRGEVRFEKGLFPWLLGSESTLVQRPGIVFTLRNTFLGDGERIDTVRFGEIERADVDALYVSGRARGTTYALVLRMKDGATIGFGIGHESWGLAKKRIAADAINRLLSSNRVSTALPSSTDAESFAGSPVAVPTLAIHDE